MSTTPSIAVVGGVYREIVLHPRRDQLFGSGARAAAILRSLGSSIVLHSAIDTDSHADLEALASTFDIELALRDVSVTTTFTYDYPLSPPRTRPMFGGVTLGEPIAISADRALVFGMVEGDPRVSAHRVVFDPQSPLRPRWFEDTGSEAEEIVYVLNWHEGQSLTEKRVPEDIVAAIVGRPGIAGVVLKLGPKGCVAIARDGHPRRIPCYETSTVWPIGTGDVFAASLAWAWLDKGLNVTEAAEAASRHTALFAEAGVLRADVDLALGTKPMPFRAVTPKSGEPARPFDVYLAGPFFSIQDRWLVEGVRDVLAGFGLRVFSPLHDVGLGDAAQVAPEDLAALDGSHVVLALLDRLDAGTLFEVGYARAKNTPVVAHVHGIPEGHLKMIVGTECDTTEDLSTALYRAAWRVPAS